MVYETLAPGPRFVQIPMCATRKHHAFPCYIAHELVETRGVIDVVHRYPRTLADGLKMKDDLLVAIYVVTNAIPVILDLGCKNVAARLINPVFRSRVLRELHQRAAGQRYLSSHLSLQTRSCSVRVPDNSEDQHHPKYHGDMCSHGGEDMVLDIRAAASSPQVLVSACLRRLHRRALSNPRLRLHRCIALMLLRENFPTSSTW
mmetsp:Transcript_16013/g.34790  ORF Transcript_16013/g.34790 Transcript_16013/m.34790 type:complete len:203 (-) Transcript_16013:77-685(-)